MNPYEVLGVPQNASDDDIKKAYRQLVKKYHPDRYAGDARAQAAASEKLKQVNEAYDTIEKMRKGGYSNQSYGNQSYGGDQSYGGYGNGGYGNSGYGNSGYGGYGNSQSSSAFAQVRQAIARNDYYTAESILSSIQTHNAEWNFLRGMIYFRRGWYEGAQQHFARAVQMDPSNQEYRQAYDALNNTANVYEEEYGGGGNIFKNPACRNGLICLVCLGAQCCCFGRSCCF